jgi:hypothetical protein
MSGDEVPFVHKSSKNHAENQQDGPDAKDKDRLEYDSQDDNAEPDAHEQGARPFSFLHTGPISFPTYCLLRGSPWLSLPYYLFRKEVRGLWPVAKERAMWEPYLR